jgi:hypothetical protein
MKTNIWKKKNDNFKRTRKNIKGGSYQNQGVQRIKSTSRNFTRKVSDRGRKYMNRRVQQGQTMVRDRVQQGQTMVRDSVQQGQTMVRDGVQQGQTMVRDGVKQGQTIVKKVRDGASQIAETGKSMAKQVKENVKGASDRVKGIIKHGQGKMTEATKQLGAQAGKIKQLASDPMKQVQKEASKRLPPGSRLAAKTLGKSASLTKKVAKKGAKVVSTAASTAVDVVKNPWNYVGDPRALLKLLKQVFTIAGKSPMRIFFDMFMNTIMNLTALYVYFPSLMINLPNSSLNNILPDDGQCQLLFGSKENCRKKLKCFFMDCNVLQDKKGYYDEKMKDMKNMTGGRREVKRSKVCYTNYDFDLCKCEEKKRKNNKKNSKNNKKPIQSGGEVKGDYSLASLMTGKFDFNNKDNSINVEKFRDLMHVFVPLKKCNGYDEDPFLVPLYRNLIYTHLNHVSIYKFLCIYEMMDTIFEDNYEEIIEEMDELYDSMYVKGEEVKIVWPVTGAILDIFDERIEGLKAQIFDAETEESDKTDVTKKNWIPCKDCTLRNTAGKAWQKLLDDLSAGEKYKLDYHIKKMFEVFVKKFDYEKFTIDQFLGLFDLNVNYFKKPMYHPFMKKYDYRKSMFMIPSMKPKKETLNGNKNVLQDFKYMYAFMRKWNINSILQFCLMKKLYNINNSGLSRVVGEKKNKLNEIYSVAKKHFIVKSTENKALVYQLIDSFTKNKFYDDVAEADKICKSFINLRKNKEMKKKKNDVLEKIFDKMTEINDENSESMTKNQEGYLDDLDSVLYEYYVYRKIRGDDFEYKKPKNYSMIGAIAHTHNVTNII